MTMRGDYDHDVWASPSDELWYARLDAHPSYQQLPSIVAEGQEELQAILGALRRREIAEAKIDAQRLLGTAQAILAEIDALPLR